MENLIKQFNKTNFFSTQVTSPASSSTQRKSFFKSKEELFTKVLHKFKQKKSQIKSVQKQYSQVLQKSHRSSVEYDEVKKKSQIIRFKFVKMYQNKRYNLLNQQLQIKLSNTKQQNHKLSTQRVQQIQIQRKNHFKYLKNQQLDIRNTRKQKNKQNKMVLFQIIKKISQLLQKSQQKINQYINKNSQKVKNQTQQFVIRKSNYKSMKGSKAKFNYMNKLKQQIQAIRDYENLLEQIGPLDIKSQQKDFITQCL